MTDRALIPPQTNVTASTAQQSGSSTTSTRRTAVLVGLLFLTATVTFLIADALIIGVMDRPDYLAGASAQANALTTAALLAFVDGVAIVGIAVLLFPLLKRHSEPLALAYVGFRVAELAAILIYLAAPLLVIQLGERVHDGDVDASALQGLGALLQAQHSVAIVMIYLFTSVAGASLAVLFYRSRLVPRSIAILGVIGYPVLLVGAVLDMFNLVDVTRGVGLLAVVPGGLFELILPIWLLARGFTRPTPDVASGAHHTSREQVGN